MNKVFTTTLLAAGMASAMSAHAVSYRVVVSVENLAPQNGTFQTPHWVGFHDGKFDIYDGGTAASTLPIPGSVAVERLAEDGNTGPITEDFSTLQPEGIDATLATPDGALAPGDIVTEHFTLDPHNPAHRYFSYGSMVLPSNDFWYANGNPLAHPVFDDKGNFIAEDFFVTVADLLDAGTEVNDEIPMNTAFFGQQAPNTGVDENGVIMDVLDADGNPQFGFMPPGSGGILDDPMFQDADFNVNGYPVVRISFNAVPAIVDNRKYAAELSGGSSVPPVDTDAHGLANYAYYDDGKKFGFYHLFKLAKDDIISASLHYGIEGDTGPVIADLFDDSTRDEHLHKTSSARSSLYVTALHGHLKAADLLGPLSGHPLDALVKAIDEGKVYVNIKTKAYPEGEIRGPLKEGQY